MKQKKIEVSVQISRTQSNMADDCMTLRITDEASRVQFVEVRMSLEDFTKAITSQFVKATAEVRELDKVGLMKVTEPRSIVCPFDPLNRKKLEQWLSDNATEEGWHVNNALQSQGSIGRPSDGKGVRLNYSVYKYVESE